ncbi:hypothetical protein J6590_074367 [Homalodisca vitripennis]|nr:hypothetical protein J6590_074367 [Homalodisca vitripennis]
MVAHSPGKGEIRVRLPAEQVTSEPPPMAGQAGRLQGQDRSVVTCPSSSHARRCLIWLSCDNRHLFHWLSIISDPTDCEICSIIRFMNARYMKPAKIYHKLRDIYGKDVKSEETVRKWVRMFNGGRRNMRIGAVGLLSSPMICAFNFLTRHSDDGEHFLNEAVTVETWVRHVTPESKQKNKRGSEFTEIAYSQCRGLNLLSSKISHQDSFVIYHEKVLYDARLKQPSANLQVTSVVDE